MTKPMNRHDVIYFRRRAEQELADLPRWAWRRRASLERDIRRYTRQLMILGDLP